MYSPLPVRSLATLRSCLLLGLFLIASSAKSDNDFKLPQMEFSLQVPRSVLVKRLNENRWMAFNLGDGTNEGMNPYFVGRAKAYEDLINELDTVLIGQR